MYVLTTLCTEALWLEVRYLMTDGRVILVTGSRGLIGRHLIQILARDGCEIREFDIRGPERLDIRIEQQLDDAMSGIDGIVHLAAISRVVWAETRPDLVESINVGGLQKILEIAASRNKKPWVIFGSSREIYGNTDKFPVTENAPYRALNVYARGKVLGEQLMLKAAEAGLVANVCRFSNVYGCIYDHIDRVCMAFANVAAIGGTITLEGGDNVFDFTHINDVAKGLAYLVELTSSKEQLTPVQFVSGRGITLQELADISMQHGCDDVKIKHAPARTFDVSQFRGDPTRAREVLGWKATTSIEFGISRLIDEIRKSNGTAGTPNWLNAVASDPTSKTSLV